MERLMIELREDALLFRFPEVHPDAELAINFQRTLRIPDDEKSYPLPPGLGRFPMRHVDDFANKVPPSWAEHGGVMLPMYQAEAMWLSFSSAHVDDRAPYCFVVKIATGKVNAVTGEDWEDGINRGPQDYLVVPTQPWIDGYCVEKGTIRQFVAMPLGSGYTAEEQVTGKADVGGLQIVVYPMKRDVFERRFPKVEMMMRSMSSQMGGPADFEMCEDMMAAPACAGAEMGLAPGGKMSQEIYDDPYDFDDWDLRHRSRCFVHLANSMVWRQIVGGEPPTVPPTAKEYEQHGLPWFDFYSDTPAVDGGGKLGKVLKSVVTLGKAKGDVPLPENEAVDPGKVVSLGKPREKGVVREW